MQTAAGLAAAHAQGLVHRDIKPANILLENGIERVRITDFGLARAVDDVSQTQSGILAGTPQYMSPEQAAGEAVDHRADLFSLGSVLYAMCAGRSPFRAESTVAVLRRICDGHPRPLREINPELPDWLVEIIDKLHQKQPEDRIQTAAEVADLLERHLAHLQQPATAPQPARLREKAGHSVVVRRRRTIWVVVSSTLAIALLTTAILVYHVHSQPSDSNAPISTASKSESNRDLSQPAAPDASVVAGSREPSQADSTLPSPGQLDERSLGQEFERLKSSVDGLEAAWRPREPVTIGKPGLVVDIEVRLKALENDLGQIQR